MTCRGRRRIGKSTLVEEFARRSGARFLKIDGLRPKPGMSERDQLAFFVSKLAAQTGCDRTPPEDWHSAFVRLDREIGDKGAVASGGEKKGGGHRQRAKDSRWSGAPPGAKRT